MRSYLNLYEKFSSANNSSSDAKHQYHEKEKDFLSSRIKNILSEDKTNLLKISQMGWIKKERTQLYILMTEVERYIAENSLRTKGDRKIKSITEAKIHHDSSHITLHNTKSQESYVMLYSSNLSGLHKLSIDELYLNLLLLLDNVHYISSLVNRNTFMQRLKERYFNTKGRTKKCEDLMLKHNISTDWLYQYLLNKNKNISSKYPLISDRYRLATLIFELRTVLDGKFDNQILSAAKAWSVKKTRQRSSIKNKPISLSQKDHELLTFIATHRDMSEKELIVSLLKGEKKELRCMEYTKKPVRS